MCSSSTKRWIIGLLLLTAVFAVAVGYLLSKKPAERADQGTLVQAEEYTAMAAGARLQAAAGDCL